MAFINFGAYTYRAWAVNDPLSTGPWEAWFEIHSQDYKSLLFGPIKLPMLFASREDAYAAAEAKVQYEINHAIGGQTWQSTQE